MNVPQLLGAVIAVFTPLLVVLTLNWAAGRQAGVRVRTPPRVLIATTILAALLVAVLMFSGTATGSVAGAISLGLFVLLAVIGWPAMGRIEQASLDALSEARPPLRRASLDPRGVGDVVPRLIRFASPLVIAIGAPLVLLRVLFPAAGQQRLIVPLTFAAAAVVFHVLYGIWIRREAESVLYFESEADDEAWRQERRTRVLRLWRMQLGLVTINLSLALVLLSIDWSTEAGRIAVSAAIVLGGIAGVIGCAIAISSGTTPAEVRRSGRSAEAR
jgi:hypothetical protein